MMRSGDKGFDNFEFEMCIQEKRRRPKETQLRVSDVLNEEIQIVFIDRFAAKLLHLINMRF